jgi:hypothetical protein
MSDTASKTNDEARTGQTLVVGNRRWGAGDTLADAKRQWRRHGGRLADGYTVYVFDSETKFYGVDLWGRYSFTGNEPTVTEVEARKRT